MCYIVDHIFWYFWTLSSDVRITSSRRLESFVSNLKPSDSVDLKHSSHRLSYYTLFLEVFNVRPREAQTPTYNRTWTHPYFRYSGQFLVKLHVKLIVFDGPSTVPLTKVVRFSVRPRVTSIRVSCLCCKGHVNGRCVRVNEKNVVECRTWRREWTRRHFGTGRVSLPGENQTGSNMGPTVKVGKLTRVGRR